ncbi:MAG: 16S rRNA (cytosine(967)-C(5))-methyltransferase RsmB [Candidatus Cloacimonetes bacterium]|nr:16S rRNA (cytosine(967)-C(5))-methyltransferase RsmB [Candidatus Cloacimonadota bacterium]
MDLVRKEAYNIIYKVLKDHHHSDRLLEQKLNRFKTCNERNFLYHLVKGTIKMQRNLDYIAASLTDKDKYAQTDLKIKSLLYLGLFQTLYCKSVPDHSAVDETVELAKGLFNTKIADFVNAVLRSFLRNPDIEYPASFTERISYELSYPIELIEKWIEYWGEESTEKLCHYFNYIPKLSLRINRMATDKERFRRYFERKDIKINQTNASPNVFQTDFGQNILRDVSFEEGYYSVQDASSAMVVELLDPQEDENILDLFAGPGGKCTYISELMNNTGEVVAVDKFPQKSKKIKQAIHRLQITNMIIVTEDAFKFGPIAPAYDRVLLDVPCSGWGIFQKKAELRWQNNQDMKTLLKLQDNALEVGAQFVKKGGFLIYSTCTMNHEENENQVEKFLQQNKNFKLITNHKTVPANFIENGFLKTFPQRDSIDGAFAAKMQKQG